MYLWVLLFASSVTVSASAHDAVGTMPELMGTSLNFSVAAQSFVTSSFHDAIFSVPTINWLPLMVMASLPVISTYV